MCAAHCTQVPRTTPWSNLKQLIAYSKNESLTSTWHSRSVPSKSVTRARHDFLNDFPFSGESFTFSLFAWDVPMAFHCRASNAITWSSPTKISANSPPQYSYQDAYSIKPCSIRIAPRSPNPHQFFFRTRFTSTETLFSDL